MVIAIDGPAASGKSTTAKLTAEKLGYVHVDTGAMYRAMTLKVLETGIELNDKEKISKLAQSTEIRFERTSESAMVILDKRDVTNEIRRQDVTNAVSAVSSIEKVREMMVREQRKIGKEGGIVLEGRDIGTVVFPDADLKIFMVADIDERARRRQRELAGHRTQIDLDTLQQEIIQRDALDSQRNISPLRKADDAILLDTSRLSIDEQVEFIVKKAKEILEKRR
ncbi:MAG: (d)CMP kinase [Bacteroidota bacterium]